MENYKINNIKKIIRYRKENFGGLVYNSKMNETYLMNNIAYEILQFILLKKEYKSIIKFISDRYNVNTINAKSLVDKVNNFLDSIDNLNQNNSDISKLEPSFEIPPEIDFENLSCPLEIEIEITSKCNLFCKHCFSKSNEIKTEEISNNRLKNIIRMMQELDIFKLAISGGEPLIRKDIYDILNYSNKHNLITSLATNGTLINKIKAKKLMDFNIDSIQISIDGLEKTHDKFRGIVGSYKKAIKGIENLISIGFPVRVVTTLSQYNVNEMVKISDILSSMGVSIWGIMSLVPVGRSLKNANILMSSKNTIMAFNDLKSKLGYNKQNMKIRYGIDDYLQKSKRKGCPAGLGTLAILSDGNYIPCTFLRNYKFILGNVNYKNIYEIWHSKKLKQFKTKISMDLEKNCKNCNMTNKCNGGCRAAAFGYTGNVGKPDLLCCEFHTQFT